MLKFFLIPALSLLLCGAASANEYESPDGVDVAPSAGAEQGSSPGSSSSHSGVSTIPQTCTASCNRSYEVCMDEQSAVPGEGGALRYDNGLADKLIGASSDCSDNLTTCLNGCGG